ncbi:hypothetical protein C8Q73DRAFT_689191 [Cubamyces lactineus]|nr:hypothetical protein C8Q73DRAFT_689191 [Cubamyces lactineus]
MHWSTKCKEYPLLSSHDPALLYTMGIIISCIVGVFACIADAIMAVVGAVVGCLECVFVAIFDAVAGLIACLTCGLCCAAVV